MAGGADDPGGEGRISRELLLSGCTGRFLRGGDATDLRFFARLHELLEPSEAEVAARARDYLRLLPVAPGPVAELALKHLRRLDGSPSGAVAGPDPVGAPGTAGSGTVVAGEARPRRRWTRPMWWRRWKGCCSGPRAAWCGPGWPGWRSS
nr:hypothetical protein GCM10020093_002550 [Planobispora longispora]